MSYITYPRSDGSRKNIKRAKEALVLIERLLNQFNAGDLNLLLALVALIDWADLPAALRAKLLQLLYYDLYKSIKAVPVTDRGAHQQRMQIVTQALVDITLKSTDRTDLSLVYRINAGGYISAKLASKKKKKGRPKVDHDVLVLDNGITVVLTASNTNQRYIEKKDHTIRSVLREHDTNSAKAIKAAHASGELVTLNLLADYISPDKDDVSEPLLYELDKFPPGIFAHSAVRSEVLRSVNRPIDTYSRQKREHYEGCQREHIIPHSCFTDRSQQALESRSKVPLRDGVGDYTELRALTYPVEDSQTQGTEHRFLTVNAVLIARKFKGEGREATLLEWLDEIERSTYLLFTNVLASSESAAYSRSYTEEEARVLAMCIRQEAQLQYERLSVPLDLKLSNKIAEVNIGSEPPRIDIDRNTH